MAKVRGHDKCSGVLRQQDHLERTQDQDYACVDFRVVAKAERQVQASST